MNKIISIVIGEPLSIDKLVFDRYSKTNLALFDNDVPTYYETKNTLVGNALGNLTTVFNLFRRIAILVYMIILVYMGLRILIMTGNAGKKAKYKELVLDWVKGIVILFFFPYVIRYTMLLNHAFVTYLYDKIENKSKIEGAVIQNHDVSLGEIDSIEIEGDSTSESVDYMTQMYQTAKRSRRISDAICWVIMVVQVVQFLLVYFKRLLTIIFLIAIFPLVTISYAVDKIGDGKSQAFNNWYKEFALQVFVQSFHAVNYVLVMSIILGDDANWFLKMIGIAYIAKGGDILRGLFAQMRGGAGGDGGPLEVAKAYVKTKLAIEGVATLRKSAAGLVGQNSMFGRGIERVQLARDGWSYESALKAEQKANRAIRLNIAHTNAENARKDAQNITNGLEDLKLQRDTYANQLADPDLSAEDRNRIEQAKKEVEEQIKNYNESFVKSVDNLARMSEEELQEAIRAAGLNPTQVAMLQGTLNHAGAIAVLRNNRNETNVDVRTAVNVVFRDRKAYESAMATGNEYLDRYIETTKDKPGITNEDIKKINAAHSITIDEAAASASVKLPEPKDTDARVDYALKMMENAHKGEYDIKELNRSARLIDSVKGDAKYASQIREAEERAGFTFEDFKVNLAVQTINDSNRIENVGDADAQALTNDAIEVVQSADKRANREILAGLNANVDELKKDYMPLLHKKEDERSKLQREFARNMKEENMLGRYGQDYENYLEERIQEVREDSNRLFVKGVTGTVLGATTGAMKAGISTAVAGVSTGATYTGTKESKPVIVGVANSVKTVDDVSGRLGKIGTKIADAVMKEGTSTKVTRGSVNINRSDHFRNSVINSAVDEEMRRRENVRNKILNRKK